MNQRMNIHMTRIRFSIVCIIVACFILLLAPLTWAAWLSIDPAWSPSLHPDKSIKHFLHGAEVIFESLPNWIRAPLMAFPALLFLSICGSGIASGILRIFRREPVAVLDERGIRGWSMWGSCSISWAEATQIEAKRLPFNWDPSVLTIIVHREPRLSNWGWEPSNIVLESRTMVFDPAEVMAFLRKSRPDLYEKMPEQGEAWGLDVAARSVQAGPNRTVDARQYLRFPEGSESEYGLRTKSALSRIMRILKEVWSDSIWLVKHGNPVIYRLIQVSLVKSIIYFAIVIAVLIGYHFWGASR
jgi:hypothetical protein